MTTRTTKEGRGRQFMGRFVSMVAPPEGIIPICFRLLHLACRCHGTSSQRWRLEGMVRLTHERGGAGLCCSWLLGLVGLGASYLVRRGRAYLPLAT